MVRGVLGIFSGCRRTGAHQGHASSQDVKELGQFVDAGLSDKFTHFCDAGVVFHLEHEAVHLIVFHELRFAGFRIGVHGAEFIHFEGAAIPADPFLGKDNGTRIIQIDGRSHKKSDQDTEDAAHQTAHDIQTAFGEELAFFEDARSEADHLLISQHFHTGFGIVYNEAVQHEEGMDSHFIQGGNDLSYVGATAVRKGDKGVVYHFSGKVCRYGLRHCG